MAKKTKEREGARKAGQGKISLIRMQGQEIVSKLKAVMRTYLFVSKCKQYFFSDLPSDLEQTINGRFSRAAARFCTFVDDVVIYCQGAWKKISCDRSFILLRFWIRHLRCPTCHVSSG